MAEMKRWLMIDIEAGMTVMYAVSWDGLLSTWEPPAGVVTMLQTDFGGPGWTYSDGFLRPPAWEPDIGKRIAALLLEKGTIDQQQYGDLVTQPLPIAISGPFIPPLDELLVARPLAARKG